MNYYTNLFSPETHKTFTESDQNISGFRERQKGAASKIKPGDRFICYLTRVSRWIGVFDILSTYYVDDTPLFYTENDPYIIRFKVKPVVWLPLEKGIPIHEDFVWNNLSFTRELDKSSPRWTGIVRNSLREMNRQDAEFLEKQLMEQSQNGKQYPLSEDEKKKLHRPTVKSVNKEVSVTIPEDEEESTKETGSLESIKIQALIADIGERMNFKIWLPRSDRSRVLSIWEQKPDILLNTLPLNYDDTTLKTIENIDVLWIRGRSIVRVFEIEHSTSIYSGILRMADLMALQPNLNIKAHIVAPSERKDKVFNEITRPVFSLLEKGPLAEFCTYISYESIIELSQEKRLEYMKDDVLDEIEEYAEEV